MPRIVGPVAIEIHDEVLFHGKGAINVWTTKVQNKARYETKKLAPVNKRTRKFPGRPPRGHLQRSISANKAFMGRKIIGITVVSKADYSIYVIKGTSTQYKRDALGRFGTNAGGFPLPANNYGKFRRVQRIRGQQANNFMLRGLQATARTHPSIKGAGHISQVFGG